MACRKILVRCDDICPTMDYGQFERARKLFKKMNIYPILGVIPDCQDPDLKIEAAHEDFWDYMLELQTEGYTLAMHGYQHMFDSNTRGKVNLGWKSEFAGHSLSEQIEKIKKGKEILEQHGIKTDIFFAPAHSYDDNTLQALAVNGFKYMSDGWSLKPYKRHGIICIPCRTGGIPKVRRKTYYTVVLHAHEWNIPKKADAYDRFEALCEKYRGDFVDFNEFVNRKCGVSYFQRIEEKACVFWRRKLFPFALSIYHKIRR